MHGCYNCNVLQKVNDVMKQTEFNCQKLDAIIDSSPFNCHIMLFRIKNAHELSTNNNGVNGFDLVKK